uniref:BLN1 n=1 Tax=Triticum aestivum TaxID=4565 RepID=A0A9E8IL90_WHEAT|nr:BLN1 [Triticum aestivum]
MVKNNSSATSVRLMLILLVLLVFVGGILANSGPSKCSNPAAQRDCPRIPNGGS